MIPSIVSADGILMCTFSWFNKRHAIVAKDFGNRRVKTWQALPLAVDWSKRLSRIELSISTVLHQREERLLSVWCMVLSSRTYRIPFITGPSLGSQWDLNIRTFMVLRYPSHRETYSVLPPRDQIKHWQIIHSAVLSNRDSQARTTSQRIQ